MSQLGWSDRIVAAVHILLLTTLMVMPAAAVGQTARRPWGFWATAGLGPATPYEVSIAASAVVRHNRILVRVRYVSVGELLGISARMSGYSWGLSSRRCEAVASLRLGLAWGECAAPAGACYVAVGRYRVWPDFFLTWRGGSP